MAVQMWGFSSLAKRAALTLAVVAAFVLPGATQPAAGITGLWLTKDQAQIEIRPCPEGYCGYIARALEPGYTDRRNKNPALRNRPIDGLQIMTLQPTGRPGAFDGRLYNPLDGNTYDGGVEVVDAHTLKMRGCVLIFCRSEEWTRLR